MIMITVTQGFLEYTRVPCIHQDKYYSKYRSINLSDGGAPSSSSDALAHNVDDDDDE